VKSVANRDGRNHCHIKGRGYKDQVVRGEAREVEQQEAVVASTRSAHHTSATVSAVVDVQIPFYVRYTCFHR
jgi:uncharacterized protein YndB with AHSA1/START domain